VPATPASHDAAREAELSCAAEAAAVLADRVAAEKALACKYSKVESHHHRHEHASSRMHVVRLPRNRQSHIVYRCHSSCRGLRELGRAGVGDCDY
jgi:hypothetical protein